MTLSRQDIYSFFKLSACRIEDYNSVSIVTEIETHQMLRHVSSRWLSLRPVLARIDEQWDNLVHYFLKQMPKDKNVNTKKAMETARYQRIKSVLESRTSRIAVNFAIFVAKILEDHFLRPFQSKSPNIHQIYPAIDKMLFALMINFIPKEHIKSTDAFELSEVNCTTTASLAKSVNFGQKVEGLIASFESLTTQQQLPIDKLKTEMRLCYIKLVETLQKKLPVKSCYRS